MNDDMTLFDREAQNLYQMPFVDLSPFGQALVRQRVGARVKPEPAATGLDLMNALRVAHAKIAELEQTNRDLWEDNQELQLRLMEEDDE
jgi:hypothetical protein